MALSTAGLVNMHVDQFPFFTKLFSIIKDFLSDATYGMKYEYLLQTSEKYPDEKFYELNSISATKFAAYIQGY